MTNRQITDEEARDIIYLLAAESGLRIRKKDLDVQTRTRTADETVTQVDENSQTYNRLRRRAEYISGKQQL